MFMLFLSWKIVFLISKNYKCSAIHMAGIICSRSHLQRHAYYFNCFYGTCQIFGGLVLFVGL